MKVPYQLALFFCLAAISSTEAAADQLPNIVVILADDYGYGSAGCYGADPRLVTTPSIDQLAEEGMLFTDASTPSSVCSPTRYALLTGRYVWRSPASDGSVVWTLDPLSIETDRPTVASLLKGKGYSTAIVGKWHLGYGSKPRTDYTEKLEPGPLELGFDYQFAVPQNHNDFTRVFVENHHVYGLRSKTLNPTKELRGGGNLGLDAPQRVDTNTMEALTIKAVEWLTTVDRERPFFLYFAPVAVHGKITPSAETAGTTRAGPYGDFIRDLDLSVGRILRTLERMGVEKDTLIIFTSDNGGVSPGRKGGEQEEALKAGLEINGELRGGKHDIWQGGFQVPFVARWPGKVPAGSTSDSMVGLVDLYATLADVVDDPVAAPFESAPDSISFLPDLLQSGASMRESIIMQSSDGVYAIRRGDWKLVEGDPFDPALRQRNTSKGDQFALQLFNLAVDPGEKKDRAKENPEIVNELLLLLNQHRNQGFSR